MFIGDGGPRERAMRALHGIVGGGEVERVITPGRMPLGYRIVGRPLIVIAGDNQQPLDFTLLKPLATEKGCDVLATYVDPHKSGHRFLIDVVLRQEGRIAHYAEYRLWLAGAERAMFVPGTGAGAAIRVVGGHLRPVSCPRVARGHRALLGIARGQAELQQRIYGGTTFATPLDRWIDH